MVAEVCYMDFSRQFHLWKRERSRSYVTDEKGENGRKGRVNNKSNYFKTASFFSIQPSILTLRPKLTVQEGAGVGKAVCAT